MAKALMLSSYQDKYIFRFAGAVCEPDACILRSRQVTNVHFVCVQGVLARRTMYIFMFCRVLFEMSSTERCGLLTESPAELNTDADSADIPCLLRDLYVLFMVFFAHASAPGEQDVASLCIQLLLASRTHEFLGVPTLLGLMTVICLDVLHEGKLCTETYDQVHLMSLSCFPEFVFYGVARLGSGVCSALPLASLSKPHQQS